MLKNIVDHCRGCRFYENQPHKPASELKTIPLAWHFAAWGLDMIGPLRTGTSGFTHILVAVDKFTKWIEAKPKETWTQPLQSVSSKELYIVSEFLMISSPTMGQISIQPSSSSFVGTWALG